MSEIQNFGIPGASTQGVIAAELPKVLQFRPELSILLAGTNNTCNSQALTPIGVYREEMRFLLAELKKAGSELILMTLPPFCPELLLERHDPNAYGDFPPEKRADDANKVIRTLALEFNASLIDLHHAFQKKDLSSADSYLLNPNNSELRDGLHPNKTGYSLIARLVFDTIRKNNLPVSRIACIGDSITYGQYMSGAGTAEGDTYPGQLATLLRQTKQTQE